MLTGAQWNEVCECTNANGRESCRKIIKLNDENDCFLVGPIAFESKDGRCVCMDGFYQRLSNVCRRESIQNNKFTKIDSIDLHSIGAESSICTSVGTQTPSVKDATIQTTHSLDSLTEESPSDLNLKSSSFSNRRIRNYVNYSKLVNSEFTKTSSFDSSLKDESTQFGESWESEIKSWSGHKHNYYRKSICQCHDPFHPKDNVYKDELVENMDDEIYYGNGNIKAHRCSCKFDHNHYPNTNSFSRRISLGLYSHANQYIPLNSIYFDKQSSVICPCYNILRHNSAIEKCEYKQDNETCTGKLRADNLNNNTLFDDSHRSTLEYKKHFNAQQQDATKVDHDRNSETKNGAFASSEYKVEIVDEKRRKSLARSEPIENYDKDLDKDTEAMDESNDLSSPLLGPKTGSVDTKEENANTTSESAAVEDETLKNDADGTTECANECHCHHHDFAPIRVRPNNKKSSRTSPLKVITLLLFGSAFLITGSALKDAYYP